MKLLKTNNKLTDQTKWSYIKVLNNYVFIKKSSILYRLITK